MPDLPEKRCASCGRRFTWRKKWERDWESVKYCSDACRRRGVRPVDLELEATIGRLLAERAPGATICPSEAARAVDPDGWRDLMEHARSAARRMVARGEAVILQKGKPVDGSTARGAIRVGRAR